MRYLLETELPDIHGLFKKDIFHNIHEEERINFNLEQEFRYPYETMRTRIKRGKLDGKGRESPMVAIEPKLIKMILCMSNIKRSLNVSDGLKLANDLIKDTDTQLKLSNWKKLRKIHHNNLEDYNKVGVSYWHRFLQRYKHLLRSKVTSAYSVDRSNFTTYLNFIDMYHHIKKILLKSLIASKLDPPVWMNESGEVVEDEMKAMGYKVDIKIDRPDLGLMMDECGCNLSQEGDKNIGGELFLTGVNDKAYTSKSIKHSHFTIIGVTQLDGNPIMCVVIVTGKSRDPLIELGVDLSQLVDLDINITSNDNGIVDESVLELLKEHCGPGKLFPGLPSCHYKGIEIPGYVAFSESGGITAEILTNIFRRLDNLHLFDKDREEGYTPFMLLDGHSSRFDLQFLEYINNDEHRWNVCLGVPYGTALWQVADSSQQNGKFKMELVKAKRELYEERMNACQHDMHLQRTDIVPLVRRCWGPSFGDSAAARRAIAQRGWRPYNQNLLLNPIIRASMTETMIENERNMTSFPHKRFGHLLGIQYRVDGKNKVRIVNDFQDNDEYSKINLQGGATSRNVTCCIVSDYDRQIARERSQQMKTVGTTVKQRLAKLKKHITATKLTLEVRQYHLDKNVCQHTRKQYDDQQAKLGELRRKEEFEYLVKCYNAKIAISRNNTSNVKEWRSMADIKTYLQPLKIKDKDPKWPSNRSGFEQLFVQWSGRRWRQLVLEKCVLDAFAEWLCEEEIKRRNKGDTR